MSLESLLLSLFATSFKFTPQISSIRQRYHIIALIVTNLVMILTSISLEITMNLFTKTNYLVGLCNCGICLGSLLSLRARNERMTTIMTIFSFHVMVLIIDYNWTAPLPCLVIVTAFPVFTMLTDLSLGYIMLNIALCVADGVYYTVKSYQIFKVTLNDEQSFQLNMLILFLFVVFCQFSAMCSAQKWIEMNTWKLATVNFERTENLTKRVIKAVSTKETLIQSLTHEIFSSTMTIREDIKNLIRCSERSKQLEEIRKIDIKVEILQTIVGNIEPNGAEAPKSSSKLISLIEKVFTFHSNLIRAKKLTVQTMIDRNMPKRLWISFPQLLQAMIHLPSYALEKTLSDAKITIYATWCSSNLSHNDMMQPITLENNANRSSAGVGLQGNIQQDSSSPPVMRSLNRATSNEEITDEYTNNEKMSQVHNFELLKTQPLKGLIDIDHVRALSDDLLQWATFSYCPQSNRLSSIMQEPLARQVSAGGEESPSKGVLKLQILCSKTIIQSLEIQKLNEMLDCTDDELDSRLGSLSPGLWACKQICRKLDAKTKVFMTSNQQIGWIIYLPVDNTEVYNLQSSPNIATIPRKRTRTTALVVDDYDMNRTLHRLLLEKEDVEVTLASDGKEALDAYIKSGGDYFDFIMMDVQMPVMDGFQAAKKMREWEALQNKNNVDILFVSGEYFNEEDVMRHLKVQGQVSNTRNIRCLRKPVDVEVIKELVKECRLRLERDA